MNIETLSAEQRAELQEKLNQANTASGWDGGEADFEKRYKDTQASFTKANEEKITLAKELAELNPKKILTMDAKTQLKVVKDLYGYDDLDTLKVMKPDLFIDGEPTGTTGADGDSLTLQLQRELELLKMQTAKKDTDWAITDFISMNKEVTASIPEFEAKVKAELKYISSELPAHERVKRATKLVSSNKDINVEAFLALQGRTTNVTQTSAQSDAEILKWQNELRKAFWLPIK